MSVRLERAIVLLMLLFAVSAASSTVSMAQTPPYVTTDDNGNYLYTVSFGVFSFSGTTPISYSLTPNAIGSTILYSAIWLNASMPNGENENFPYIGSSTINSATDTFFGSTTQVCGDQGCSSVIANLEMSWHFYPVDPPKLSIALTQIEDVWNGSTTLEVVSPTMNYSPTGWAGWSCPSEDPHVVDGGYEPSDASVLNSLAWKPGASVGAYSYPTTPFGYTYGVGEEGWIVQAGEGTPLPTNVVVFCGPSLPHDYENFHLFWIHSVTDYTRWLVEGSCDNGNIQVATPIASIADQSGVAVLKEDTAITVVNDPAQPLVCTVLNWQDYGVTVPVLGGQFSNPVLSGHNLVIDFGVDVSQVDPTVDLVVAPPPSPNSVGNGGVWYVQTSATMLTATSTPPSSIPSLSPSSPPSLSTLILWQELENWLNGPTRGVPRIPSLLIVFAAGLVLVFMLKKKRRTRHRRY